MRFNSIDLVLLGIVSLATPIVGCVIAANNRARTKRTTNYEKIALDNVRVFDGSCIQPPSTVIIDGPLIGSDPAGAIHIDGKGGILLPGFIDAHCHPTNTTHMEDLAKWGVTSAFLMACFSPESCTSLQNHPGLPSVLRASAPASAPGSAHGMITTIVDASLLLNSTAEIPTWMDRQSSSDPNYFKLIAETPGFDQATLDALVIQAQSRGKQSVMHAATQEAFIQAIHSRANHIHHAPLDSILPTSMIEPMLQNAQVVTPTLTMMRATSLNLNRNFSAALLTTSLLHAAGVPILAGTDGNMQPGVPAQVPFGTSMHDELENLVEAGMSNVEALRAATVNAATAFGLRDRGVVKTGMRADLVLVGGNPLEDLKHTRDIKAVWIGGVNVDTI
ncbi:hypothetical protein DM02DRAFT_641687 [Periconia macrospinosa]|uniref:Amidohydrolase-related domain-containing protein n=1 Tax=Periconia macrospinosa TaxID=97972 RepID=A0A2V1DUU5_9PLEO|nr:hypothetical protein DM02DRAFT_641687 [Periconia macrospinosa]